MYSRFLLQTKNSRLHLPTIIKYNVQSLSTVSSGASPIRSRTRAKRYINNNNIEDIQLSNSTTKQININVDRDIFNTPSPTFRNPVVKNLSSEEHTVISHTHPESFRLDKQKLTETLSKLNLHFKDNILPSSIIESLSLNTTQHSYAKLNKYFFTGNLIYNTVVNEYISKKTDCDYETKTEYKTIVKGSYFLRKQCESNGLTEFICGSMPSEQSKFKLFYLKYFYYRCLIQLVGAIYQEKGFQETSEFIHNIILKSQTYQPEQYILEFPEFVVLKRFFQYKIEPPHIIISPPGFRCPIYRGIIMSGKKRLVETYGIDENEVKSHAFELLNGECSSITSVLTLLMKEKPITDLEEASFEQHPQTNAI